MDDRDEDESEGIFTLGTEEVPSDVKQTAACILLDQLLTSKVVTPQLAEKYTKRLVKLHEGILRTYRNARDLNGQLANLRDELSDQKEKLKQSGTQAFEDANLISNYKKELAKVRTSLIISCDQAQAETVACTEREESERLEVESLQKKKKELEEQLEAERRRKSEELEPTIQALKEEVATLKDLIATEKILAERCEMDRNEKISKIEGAQQEKRELEAVINAHRTEFSRIRGDPEKYRKQADVVATAVKTIKAEGERLQSILIEHETELNNQSKIRKEGTDQSTMLAIQLDKHRNAIEQKERQCNQIIKDSEKEKLRYQQELETRQVLEAEIKRATIIIRRKNEELMGRERDANNAIKRVRRAKFMLEQVKKQCPEYQNRIDEMRRELDKEEVLTKSQHQKLDELRYDRDLLINNFLRQEDLEKGKAELLRGLVKETREMEQELEYLVKQEQILNRQITELSIERDVKRNDAIRAAGTFEKARNELKLKNLLIVDLEKVQSDSDATLKKFEGLYEIVKNERNKYSNMLSQTQLLGSELSEKIKILQNEIDILKSESSTKDKALTTERIHYQAICADRDAARGDINKATYTCQLKEENVEQGMAEIKKLNTIIKSAENEMLMMRKKYEATLKSRNTTGIQVIHKNDELSTLYEKANIREHILRNGEVELKKREEEIRVLRLHISEVEREILVTRKMEPLIPKLEQEKEALQALLMERRSEARQLSFELESPENSRRWRSLEGKDPTPEELQAKIAAQERKLNQKQEKILEKDMTLKQAQSLAEKLQKEIDSKVEKGKQIAIKINELEVKLRNMNSKVTATLSEVAVHQQLHFQFEKEKEALQQELKQAHARFDAGEAPTGAAEKEWQTYKNQELQRASSYVILTHPTNLDRADQPHQEENLTQDGYFTTAERRSNMYIPETGLQLPKPYGAFAPMKPAELGANLRHYRNPRNKMEI